MAFAMVKWIEEDRLSVIPSGWVLQPTPIVANDLPIEGVCYWKKKSSRHNTLIIEVSDSKKDLEQLMVDDNSKNEGSKDTSNNLKQSRQETKDTDISLPKKRKEHREAIKAQKAAVIAATNKMAKEIFQVRSENVPSYSELENQLKTLQQQHQQTSQKLTDSNEMIAELTTQLNDKQSSLEAKRLVISDLEEKVYTLEGDNEDLKCQLYEAECKTGNRVSPKDFPHASTFDLKFLERLVLFYSSKTSSTSLVIQESTTHSGGVDIDDNVLEEPTQAVSQAGSPNACTSQPITMTVESTSLRTVTCGKYTYTITSHDLQQEQEAFVAGGGKRELVKDFGVYVKYVELEHFEQSSKNSPTGLMRNLISIWYSNARLAACSATSGINPNIRTSVFKYCELKYPGTTADKLKRDLTSKCGEERRKLTK